MAMLQTDYNPQQNQTIQFSPNVCRIWQGISLQGQESLPKRRNNYFPTRHLCLQIQ